MHELNVTLLAIGGLVLFLGLFSGYFRHKWWASDPLIALILGILLGSVALNLVNPFNWGLKLETILEQASRLTLAIGLMGVALRLPRNYVLTKWRSLSILLGIVMPLMWLSSGLLVYLIFGLPIWESLLVGATITPTDPIVATSIVTGAVAKRNLSERLRNLISAESGLNDGLAYPFVWLPILMLKRSPTEAVTHWLTRFMLWEVGGAIAIGALLGYFAGRLLEWAEDKKTIEEQSFLGYTIALSLAVLGAAKLLGTDGILAVFIAGLSFSDVVKGSERAEEENVQEAINRFFTLPIFILLGSVLPLQEWRMLGWKAIALVVAVLLLRRIPAFLLVTPILKPLKNWPETLFVGWFGPIGVSAIFYAALVLHETGLRSAWVMGSLVICASIVAHGFTATTLSRRYGRWHQKHSRNPT